MNLSRVLALASLFIAAASGASLYIGTYTDKGTSKGIYLAQFDSQTGSLSDPQLVAESKDPSFVALHPSKRFLYAVNESTAMVSAFHIEQSTGKLTFLNSQGTKGDGPCHLALDATGQMLMVANYGGGSIVAYPVGADGSIGASSAFVQFPQPKQKTARQDGPHAHSITFTPDNQTVFVDDLGNDRAMIFRVHPDSATLEPADPPAGIEEPASGPRHLVISPNHRFVYVANELSSSVTRFAFNPAKDTLERMDTVSALPADFHGENTGAEIAIDKKGKTVYASNRGNDSIAVFHVDSKGALHLIQNAPCGGKEPRNFALDPTGKWLLSANQNSNTITVMKVRPDGQLTLSGNPVNAPAPVCLLFSNQSH